MTHERVKLSTLIERKNAINADIRAAHFKRDNAKTKLEVDAINSTIEYLSIRRKVVQSLMHAIVKTNEAQHAIV